MNCKRLLLFFPLALCMLMGVPILLLLTQKAKRGPPPVVKPVIISGVEYRVPNNYLKEGIVEAWDTNRTKLLWSKKVYFTLHIPFFIEEDTQWDFIKSMFVGPSTNELTIINETGAKYILDTYTQRVRKVNSP
jgi:hypothetical protein